jgi:hypothetical protein
MVCVLYSHDVRSPLDQRFETRVLRDSERSTEQAAYPFAFRSG